MINTGCYYKLDNKVVFARRVIECQDEACVEVYNARRSTQKERNASLFFEEYQPCGVPYNIGISAFTEAENLCKGCLDCIYCHASPSAVEFANATSNNALLKHRSLFCDLRSGFINLPTESLIVSGCAYRRTTVPEIEKMPNDMFGFKTGIANIVRSNDSCITNPQMHMIPPNTFMKICSLLDKNELVFLGSGDSVAAFGGVMHESLSDYLANPMEDAHVICMRAGDATRDSYAYLLSELSDNPCYALLAPSIGIAVYGDDITIDASQKYGYSIYAQDDVICKLAVDEEREKRDCESFLQARLR